MIYRVGVRRRKKYFTLVVEFSWLDDAVFLLSDIHYNQFQSTIDENSKGRYAT